jgi:hypothetical protein
MVQIDLLKDTNPRMDSLVEIPFPRWERTFKGKIKVLAARLA